MRKQNSPQNLLKEMEELLRLRNYSPGTIKAYLFYVRGFLLFAYGYIILISVALNY